MTELGSFCIIILSECKGKKRYEYWLIMKKYE